MMTFICSTLKLKCVPLTKPSMTKVFVSTHIIGKTLDVSHIYINTTQPFVQIEMSMTI